MYHVVGHDEVTHETVDRWESITAAGGDVRTVSTLPDLYVPPGLEPNGTPAVDVVNEADDGIIAPGAAEMHAWPSSRPRPPTGSRS
jgi:hypothetical protein